MTWVFCFQLPLRRNAKLGDFTLRIDYLLWLEYWNEMDRQSKKELLMVVERKDEQLRRYEARLRGT